MSDTTNLSIDLGIPQTPEFAGDPMTFLEFQRIYNAINNLAGYLDEYTGRAPLTTSVRAGYAPLSGMRNQYLDVPYGYAQEDIQAGSACYTRWDATNGRLLVSKASASAADTFCTCFCVTDGGVTTGSLVAVQFSGGVIPYIGSLIEGQTYYLSNTPGVISNVPGTVVQKLGYAIKSNYFYFCPNPP